MFILTKRINSLDNFLQTKEVEFLCNNYATENLIYTKVLYQTSNFQLSCESRKPETTCGYMCCNCQNVHATEPRTMSGWLVVSMSPSHTAGRGFMFRSGHTKDHHKNGTN